MPDFVDPADQKVLDDVEKHGWHVVKVLPEGDFPGFAYTVGLFKTFTHPEVLIYGISGDRAHRILNDLGDAIRAGHRFNAGQTDDTLLEGYSCTFRTIPPAQFREHLGFASWFYEGNEFPALQLVYPDRQGRWPWQAGVNEGFRLNQPVLADSAIPSSDAGGAA